MTVKWTTNPQESSTSFKNQSFFDDFNWDLFQAGDIVWLEDYRGDDVQFDNAIVGIVARFDFNDPVIRVLPQVAAKALARIDGQSGPLESVIGLNDYFEQFMLSLKEK